jgi:hypothetical protein
MSADIVDIEYLINEAQTLFLCMKADTNVAKDIQAEMVEIVKAWQRGKLLPRHKAPTLMRIYTRAVDSDGEPILGPDPERA